MPVATSPTKAQLAAQLRRGLDLHVLDDSGVDPGEAAIYTLSDPRDILLIRYVGQTNNPQRRFRQHINEARLWLPDERPWWVKSPQLRPVYGWIRELHRDEWRLPVMRVVAWTDARHARMEERNRICEYLGGQLPLLNRERETFNAAQLVLPAS